MAKRLARTIGKDETLLLRVVVLVVMVVSCVCVLLLQVTRKLSPFDIFFSAIAKKKTI